MIGNKSHNNKGLSLYLTIIVTGIILFIVLAITGISFRQLNIAGIGDQSQQAFYAANSGLECALFWDLHWAPFKTPADGDDFEGEMIKCGDTQIDTGGDGGDASVVITEDEGEIEECESDDDCVKTTITGINFSDINCNAQISITKREIENVGFFTTIMVRGESGACSGGEAGQYQRGVRAQYGPEE